MNASEDMCMDLGGFACQMLTGSHGCACVPFRKRRAHAPTKAKSMPHHSISEDLEGFA